MVGTGIMHKNPASLSQVAALNHAADSLGLYRAELARILGLMCGDVSDARQLESLLESSTECQDRAEQLVIFYESLNEKFSGDSVAMLNWFRRDNRNLDTTPFLALVDKGRLDELIRLMKL